MFELERVKTDPDGPAQPFRVALPVTTVSESPATLDGDNARLETFAGRTSDVLVFVDDPKVAVTVADVEESTP